MISPRSCNETGNPKVFKRKTADGLNKETNKRAKSNKKIVLPYIKNVSEMNIG